MPDAADGRRRPAFSPPRKPPPPETILVLGRFKKNPKNELPKVDLERDEELFIQEVNEELKAERTVAILKRYGTFFVVAAALAVGGVWYWQNAKSAREQERYQASAQYTSASELARQGKSAEAIKQFAAIAKSGPAGYAALSGLQQADLLAASGKLEEAAAVYKSVAEKSGAPKIMRDMATVYWALHALDSAEPKDMIARLAPLTNPESPWRFSAREVIGLYYFKSGDAAKAREVFEALSKAPKAPASLRGRALEMLAILRKS
jgi:hypothetical protein